MWQYGVMQMWHAPSLSLAVINAACWVATSSTYVGTNLHMLDWDRWHSVGMHIVPGFWCFVVATWHRPVMEMEL